MVWCLYDPLQMVHCSTKPFLELPSGWVMEEKCEKQEICSDISMNHIDLIEKDGKRNG